MKSHFKKFISILLTFAICLSLGIPAFAAENNAAPQISTATTADVYAAAKNAYESLTVEQKEAFLLEIEVLALNGDTSLVEFHQTYVDPDYQYNSFATQGKITNSVNARNAASVAQQLQALNLPSAVYYGLLAFATSLGVPVGNIVDLVIGLGLGVIIIANWDAISSAWNDIIDIFADAFGSVVMDAFYYLQGLVGIYTVSVSGQTITINGEQYYCDEDAEVVATSMQSSGHLYYPAYRTNNKILVCPVEIPREAAIEIMKLNSSRAGVFALYGSHARSICQTLGGTVRHDIETGSGYWNHYHSSNFSNAHCWYFI